MKIEPAVQRRRARRRARRQVDLAPLRAARRARRGRDARAPASGAPATRRRRSTRCARSASRSRTSPRTSCVVHGVGLRGLRRRHRRLRERGHAACGSSRASLAGQSGRFELTGDESLSTRPMERIAEPLRQMGAQIETTDGHAPVVIEGSDALHGIDVRAAGRERAGEVGDPARRAQRGRADDRRRADADARPHRADAREPPASRVRRAADGGHGRARGARCGSARSTCPATSRRPRRFSPRPRSSRAATSRSTTSGLNPRRTGLLDVLERMGARVSRSSTGAARRASPSATCRSSTPSSSRSR